jgi:hypothetical protein
MCDGAEEEDGVEEEFVGGYCRGCTDSRQA